MEGSSIFSQISEGLESLKLSKRIIKEPPKSYTMMNQNKEDEENKWGEKAKDKEEMFYRMNEKVMSFMNKAFLQG